jgi:hypothetical protein
MKAKDYFIILVPIALMFLSQYVTFEHRLTKVETKVDLLLDHRGIFNEDQNFRH